MIKCSKCGGDTVAVSDNGRFCSKCPHLDTGKKNIFTAKYALQIAEHIEQKTTEESEHDCGYYVSLHDLMDGQGYKEYEWDFRAGDYNSSWAKIRIVQELRAYSKWRGAMVKTDG